VTYLSSAKYFDKYMLVDVKAATSGLLTGVKIYELITRRLEEYVSIKIEYGDGN
jgi:hypothetical protein